MPRFVAVVESDIHNVGINFWNIEDLGPHTLQISEIAGGGNFLARGGSLGRIYCIDVVVFIAALVLNEENVFTITAPKISWNGAGGIVRDRLSGGEWLARSLDPYI